MELKKDITEEIWDQYYNLIYKMCHKYQYINWMFDIDDLLSESYICLKQCYESYDPGRGSFSTFLFTSLNNHLYRVVNGKSSKDKGNKLLNDCISIYQTLTDTDDDCMLIDTIEDEVAQEMIDNLPEIMFISDLHDKLDNALNNLTDKQKTVIECINGYNSETFSEAEMAAYMNVTPGRINEIKNNAYRKLRHNKELREIFFEEFRS